MDALFTLLGVFFALVVWFVFFGTLVRQRMYRRCEELDGQTCCGLHFLGCVLGYMGGPLTYGTVLLYEVADGTFIRRKRAWKAEAQELREFVGK